MRASSVAMVVMCSSPTRSSAAWSCPRAELRPPDDRLPLGRARCGGDGLNLLSVGAAYGLIVLVFLEGVGRDLFGFTEVEVIAAWLPLEWLPHLEIEGGAGAGPSTRR